MQVIAIGLGQPKHAERYCGKLAPSVTCLTNEKSHLNRAYGLENASVAALLLSPNAMKNGLRATRKGFRQGRSTGNVMMLPGTFVVDRDGVIQYAHYSKNAGDHPEIDLSLIHI